MRTAALVLALALAFVSSASASPIYRYKFDFTDGTNTATGVVTMAPYDFPAGWGDTVCGPCDPNAIIRDIEFTSLSPYVQQTLGESGGLDLGPFTLPGQFPFFPGYVNYFTLDANGVILAGDFWRASDCQLDCGHMRIDPGFGSLFLAHATFPQGIVDEVSLRGSVDVDPVPEPGSVALLAMGVIGFLGVRRRTLRA